MSTSWSAGVSTSRTNKHTGYAGWLHAHIYTHCWSLFLYLAYGHNNAPINIMPHYPPPGRCRRRSGDLNYAKFKCSTYWACQSVKAQSSLHLKHGDLREDLLVIMFTLLYMHMMNCQIPHVWHLKETKYSRSAVSFDESANIKVSDLGSLHSTSSYRSLIAKPTDSIKELIGHCKDSIRSMPSCHARGIHAEGWNKRS